MTGHLCPFCNHSFVVTTDTHSSFRVKFTGVNDLGASAYLRIDIYHCPLCNEETVLARGVGGYVENRRIDIYPQGNRLTFPQYVPAAIRNDYVEACTIKNDSPKAAATLARRCLQGVIRDFWGITKNRLIDEINELSDKVPAAQWAAIDAVRKIGNIGAHMEKDVNLLLDVDPDEADKLLRLIELLIDKWYIARHDEETLLKEITDLAAEKQAQKKSQ